MSKTRVAITGLGAICGLGHSVQEVWSNALEGKSGVSPFEHTDTSQLIVNFGGEVKNFKLSDDVLAEIEQPRFDRFTHYALQAAHEAYQHSGLDQESSYLRSRMGCIMGVGIGGFHKIEEFHTAFHERGLRRVSPFFIPSIIPNMASGMVSIRLDLKGINFCIASACASSAHALQSAYY